MECEGPIVLGSGLARSAFKHCGLRVFSNQVKFCWGLSYLGVGGGSEVCGLGCEDGLAVR